MVLRKIAIFSLLVFAFMQWTSLQHDIEHLQEAVYLAHCSDESKEDSKELNHCEHCLTLNNLNYAFIYNDQLEFNKQLNSTLNDSYRVFAFTHFYSINSVRGPPQIS